MERQQGDSRSIDRLADLFAVLERGQRLEIPGLPVDGLAHWDIQESTPVVIAETQPRHYLGHGSGADARRFDEAGIRTVPSPKITRQDKKYANRAVMYRRLATDQWVIVILEIAMLNQPAHKIRTVFFVPEQEVRRRRGLEPWLWGEEE